MKTEIIDATEEIIEEESLEDQLRFLLIAKDETLAEIYEFGDEEYLIEKLRKIREEIEKIEKLISI
jgi:hypothetical protein